MFSWTLFFNTNKKGAESSKFLNFFNFTQLFKWDDILWYFPGLCGVSEITMWHTRQASMNTSRMFPYSRRMMIVLWRPLHSVFSDKMIEAFSFQCHQQFWKDLPMKQTLHWRLIWPNFVSQCCVHRVSLKETKQLDFCFTVYKATMISRALSSHFVSWF